MVRARDVSPTRIPAQEPKGRQSRSLFRVSIDLSGNQLGGEILAELGDLSNLTLLDLSDNQLSVKLSHDLTRLSALNRFYFHGNEGLCAPADDAFQEWLNGVASKRGDVCRVDSTSTGSPTSMPIVAPSPTPTTISTPARSVEDSNVGDSGGAFTARTGGSAGDVAVIALPLLGLLGLTGRRRWRRQIQRRSARPLSDQHNGWYRCQG